MFLSDLSPFFKGKQAMGLSRGFFFVFGQF